MFCATQSGALRDSIRIQTSQQDGSVGADIFSDGDVPYAAIQEYGGKTAAHEILPDKARVLAFVLNGKQVFARRIQHPGSQIPERSYLRSALEEQGDDIAQGLTDVVTRLSERFEGYRMMNSREAILEALCARLAEAQFATPINGCDTWALLSRRLKLWSDVAGADQPALFVTEHGETVAYGSESLPGKTMLNVDLFVYIAAGKDPDCIPARDLNVALDALAILPRARPRRGPADARRTGRALPYRGADRQRSRRPRRAGPRAGSRQNSCALSPWEAGTNARWNKA